MIHHIDGDRTNNEPENLEVVTSNAEHLFKHRHPDSNRQKPGEENPVIECACGCGEKFQKFDSLGRPRKYISGHNTGERNG
jgi:hypothetical protein